MTTLGIAAAQEASARSARPRPAIGRNTIQDGLMICSNHETRRSVHGLLVLSFFSFFFSFSNFAEVDDEETDIFAVALAEEDEDAGIEGGKAISIHMLISSLLSCVQGQQRHQQKRQNYSLAFCFLSIFASRSTFLSSACFFSLASGQEELSF